MVTVERTRILIPHCPIEVADDKRPVNFVFGGPIRASRGSNEMRVIEPDDWAVAPQMWRPSGLDGYRQP